MKECASRIRQAIRAAGLTPATLISSGSLPAGTLNGLLYKGRQPNLVTLQALDRAGIDVQFIITGQWRTRRSFWRALAGWFKFKRKNETA